MLFDISACFSVSTFLRFALMVRWWAGSLGVRLAWSCAFSFRSSASCFSNTDLGVFAVTVMALLPPPPPPPLDGLRDDGRLPSPALPLRAPKRELLVDLRSSK